MNMLAGTSNILNQPLNDRTVKPPTDEWIEVTPLRRRAGQGKPATVSVNKTSVQFMIRSDQVQTDFEGRVLVYIGKGGKIRLVRTNKVGAGFKARLFNKRIWLSVAKSVVGEGAEMLRGVYTVKQDGPFAIILTPEVKA